MGLLGYLPQYLLIIHYMLCGCQVGICKILQKLIYNFDCSKINFNELEKKAKVGKTYNNVKELDFFVNFVEFCRNFFTIFYIFLLLLLPFCSSIVLVDFLLHKIPYFIITVFILLISHNFFLR